MRKILVVIPSFLHGGTNRSFCNIIDLFNFSEHDIVVDVLCIKDNSVGSYKAEFKNRNINILAENKILSMLFYMGNNVIKKAIKKSEYILRKACKQYDNRYSAVVAMEEGITTQIASYIQAPKKYAWLRCMYDRYHSINPGREESEYYDSIDAIVCVSEACKKSFLQIYPRYSTRTICIANAQNREAILKKSYEESDIKFSKKYFNIVSVGRLDEVKQFDVIPQIAKELKDNGKEIKWYIIGDGGEKSKIEEEISKHKVENEVVLAGPRDNPYPAMKNADLVAVTSSSESFCNVIAEALILETPIICASFPAAYDILQNKKHGIICPIQSFAKHILALIHETHIDNGERSVFSNKEDVSSKEFVRKLEVLLCH